MILHEARVATVERGGDLLLTESGPRWATRAGRLRHTARHEVEAPAVGDWVRYEEEQGSLRIVEVLPRRTVLARKASGKTSDAQVVAANLDRVFVVTAVGEDFSPRRLERFVTLVKHGGAEPVVVLTKTDLPFDVLEVMQRIDEAAPGVPLCMVSSLDGKLDELAPYLKPGETVALVGSSGVGKSTLVNALCGEDRQAVASVRAGDDKGRHTTTRRELVALPSGAFLVDTPGVREVGLVGDTEAPDAAFEDVVEIAEGCRFSDCAHEAEPGCAVRAALEAGTLTEARWASYVALRKEAAYEARRADAKAAYDTKKRWKEIHMGVRQRRKIDPKMR